MLVIVENERESPPLFVRALAPTMCQAGTAVSLMCHVEGTPLPTVQWFKDGACVDTAPGYTITYNNGEAVLSVDSPTADHQGLYCCQATNRLGTESSSASLTVQRRLHCSTHLLM